jgi:hypothetical protein
MAHISAAFAPGLAVMPEPVRIGLEFHSGAVLCALENKG